MPGHVRSRSAGTRRGPRSGASGFRSQVSCCAGPPHMNSRMHAFAGRNETGGGLSRGEVPSLEQRRQVQPEEAEPASPEDSRGVRPLASFRLPQPADRPIRRDSPFKWFPIWTDHTPRSSRGQAYPLSGCFHFLWSGRTQVRFLARYTHGERDTGKTHQVSRRSYRAAVIGRTGRGDYGHSLDLALLEQPERMLVAVADEEPRVGAGSGEEWLGVDRAYADYCEMSRRRNRPSSRSAPRRPDGHRDMITSCAEHGVVGILCEKPPAPDPASCDAIVAACERVDVKLAMVFQTRGYAGYTYWARNWSLPARSARCWSSAAGARRTWSAAARTDLSAPTSWTSCAAFWETPRGASRA